MKDLKKVLAISLCVLTLVFGILVMVEERNVFRELANLSFVNRFAAGMSVLIICYLVINVLLILYPLVNLFLVAFNKKNGQPYKAITSCALIIAAKYLFILFAMMLYMLIAGAPWESWKDFLFGEQMAIVPICIFLGGYIFIKLSSMKHLEGTFQRALFITIGAGATIFGIIFYKAFKGMNTLGVFGLIVGILCLSGAILYSFLPQTREYSK